MNENQREWVIGVSFLIIGIIIGGGLLYLYSTQKVISSNSSVISATLIIDFGNNKTMTFKNVTLQNATAYSILMECAKPENGNFSVKATYWASYDSMFIEEIGNVKNGENGKYWQYYVNDKLPMVGANKYYLKNGDVVKWVFEKSEMS